LQSALAAAGVQSRPQVIPARQVARGRR
jgi:hypothetical protein